MEIITYSMASWTGRLDIEVSTLRNVCRIRYDAVALSYWIIFPVQ